MIKRQIDMGHPVISLLLSAGSLFLIGGLLILVVGLMLAVGIRYWPIPPKTKCTDSQQEGIDVIAPAFWNLGKENGIYIPGMANQHISMKIESCLKQFKIVYTQKAVSDDLVKLLNGDLSQVQQMHLDNDKNVRTLEAMVCTAEQLRPETKRIALIAHPKHMFRSRQALKAALMPKFPKVEVLQIHLGETPYHRDGQLAPWAWALREVIVRPSQFLLIQKDRIFGFTCTAPPPSSN